MKKQETEQTVMTDAGLDTMLAQLAEDVPPMPADFHDRWINAVRAEAQDAAHAEEPAPDKKTATMIHWTRILSVAAVFVFLIGGTLLYRTTKKTLSVPYAAEKREAAEAVAVSAGGPSAEEAAETETEAAEEAPDEAAKAEEPAAAESLLQDAAGNEAPKAAGAGNEDKMYALKADSAVQNSLAVSVPAENAEEEAGYAAEAAEYDMAPVFEAAEEVSATMMPTPEPTSAPVPSPAAAVTEVPVPAEEPGQAGFPQAAGEFFTDMGDFLLAALPYLAILAVPAVIALVVRRRKAGRP